MTYDKNKYKIWDWKSPLILHWIINPAVAVFELLFGIAIPKVMLIDREGEGKIPYYKRSYVPCPHCGTLHNGLKWSQQNKTAFKNWFGYYCDNCSNIIPIHRNFLSLIVLVISYPVWGWFKESLKQYWMDKQPDRFKNITFEIPEKLKSNKFWMRYGLMFGLLMYVLNVILFPLAMDEEIRIIELIIGIPIWFLFGLGIGYMNRTFFNRKGRNRKSLQL
jgi:hypothetical protein